MGRRTQNVERVGISSTLIAIMLVSAILGAFMPVHGAGDDMKLKKDPGVLLDSRDESDVASQSIVTRKILEKPREGLLWADWSDQYGLGLLSKLSATLAGFVFIAIMAVLQASAKRESHQAKSDSDGQAFGATLSSLLAAFIILIISADLYARCCGDGIEIRQQAIESVSNYVLAAGLVMMMFGINWALELYQPHASVKWTARWLFWAMLVYTWTVLIPTSGWTVEAVASYLRLDAPKAKTSLYQWHQDMSYLVWSVLLISVPPLLGAFAARSKGIMNKVIGLYQRRYWPISTVAAAVLASIWCQLVPELVLYTGDPHHPIVLRDLTRLFVFHDPRPSFALLLGMFGLFSAACVVHLPPKDAPQEQGEPDTSAGEES
ncbi:MAG: hypothetical protein V1792_08180 [Pseudomonadota bacterium]